MTLDEIKQRCRDIRADADKRGERAMFGNRDYYMGRDSVAFEILNLLENVAVDESDYAGA